MRRFTSFSLLSWLLCFATVCCLHQPVSSALPDAPKGNSSLIDHNATSVVKRNRTLTKKSGSKKAKKNKTIKKNDSETEAKPAFNETKALIASVLASNSTQRLRNKVRDIKPVEIAQFARKYQLQITIATAIIAFHRELYHILRHLGWHLLTKPVRDPNTGRWIRARRPISIIAVLKTIVVVDFLRRMHERNQGAGNGSDDDASSSSGGFPPLAAALLLGRRGNPALALLLSKFLSPSNTAYVPPVQQHYTFERLNERYTKDNMALQKVLGRKKVHAPQKNATKLSDLLLGTRSSSVNDVVYNETVIVMDLGHLDTSVSQMEVVRDEVSFLLNAHKKQLEEQQSSNETTAAPSIEVVVLLESPGGSAADYSLASQQIMRLRKHGIPVTICVDKVAASGGYMIASVASPGRLLAAPFAVLGSIGVIGQTFNIHKTLEGWGVRPLVFRGGRDKAPVGLIGEVTEEGMEKVQMMIDKTHQAFKRHVTESRPGLSKTIDEIATGEIWLGVDALEVGLVDRIITSDEYIGERIAGGARVLKLVQLVRPRYPFQKPRTTTEMAEVRGDGISSALSNLRFLQTWVGKAKDALGRVAVDSDDGTGTLARAMGVHDVSCHISPSN